MAPGLPKGLCSQCALKGALELGGNESVRQAPEASRETLAGRRFGDYELLQEIARGGMGVVYRARQTSLDRIVAVKLLLFEPMAGPELIRRFRVEAVTAGSLRHPNIVAIHEVGIHEGRHFLVMDYVNGPNLAKFVREEPPPARRAAGFVKTIAEAIHYAHESGILHRDLKPSNVLMDSNQEPRVTDFGLARRLDGDSSLTLSGQVLGSPNYMPPEQAAGCCNRGRVSRRSDVYGLGAILYHMLTGRPPFHGETLTDTLHQVLNNEPVSPCLLHPGLPPELETICLKCLEKEPQRRYATAQEVADELGRYLHGKPIQARPAGPMLRTGRWLRRNPAGAALMAALFLGLSAAIGLLKVVNDQRKSEQEAVRIIRRRLILNIEELWQRSDKPSELISSEELAALKGRRKSPATAETIRLRVGLSASEGPLVQAEKYLPLLDFLEEKMEPTLQRPVRVDIELFKSGQLSKEGLAKGNLDLTRMGALNYLRARDANFQLAALVQEISRKDAVVFARRGLGITNLNQLRGRSFAFGDTNATLSVWAKVFMTRAGILGANLSRYAHLNSREAFLEDIRQHGFREEMQGDLHSHSQVIKEVLDGTFDAGVARVKYVATYLGKELVPLYDFDSTSNFWVARRGLPADVQEALKAAILSITNDEILRALPTKAVGFRAVSERDLADLEQALHRDVALFEGRPVKRAGHLGGDE